MNKKGLVSYAAFCVAFACSFAAMVLAENLDKEHLTKQPDGTYV